MNNAQPLVTVAMVTYNSAPYIQAAIESVLHSTYQNFELVISDDNSTDDTWAIIQRYNDPRISSWRNTVNVGEYNNRNRCIEAAKGEYLIFIDGDDMIYPHGLQLMVKQLHAFPDCAMALMCWFRNNVFYPVVITPKQLYVGEYFGSGFLGTAFSNVLFRTALVRSEGGLSTAYRNGDDFIRYKIGRKYNSLVIQDGLTWWRETPGQASQQGHSGGQLFLDSYRIKWLFLADPECPLDADEQKKAARNIRIQLSRATVKHLIKFQFSIARRVVRAFGLSWHKVPVDFFGRQYLVHPLAAYSPANPYMLPFSKNPLKSL